MWDHLWFVPAVGTFSTFNRKPGDSLREHRRNLYPINFTLISCGRRAHPRQPRIALLRIALGAMFWRIGCSVLRSPCRNGWFLRSVGFPGFLAYNVVVLLMVLAGVALLAGFRHASSLPRRSWS